MKEFEWFEWFGPSPIEPFNSGADAAARISADLDFDGGAIPIGEREVVASQGMEALGVACRPVAATLCDMAEALTGDALASSPADVDVDRPE